MLTSAATDPELRELPTRLEAPDLIRAFRIMYMSRRIDDREILLKRQNKIFFQVSGAGHEGIQTAVGLALRPGHDWFFPYYRDRALSLALGMTAEDMLLPAVGCAEANRYLDPASDAVTLTSIGEGATSEGEFWEAINAACLESLPVIFLIQDNGFAISVPVEHQTPGGDISKLVEGHPNLRVFRCDGTNFLCSYATFAEAVNYCRRERKPAFVHALCTRPYSHSLSDDEKLYKTAAERAEEARRDPMVTFADYLTTTGVLDRGGLEQLAQEVDLEIQQVTERALKAAPPAKGSALRYLYSETVDPTSSAFETEAKCSGNPRTMVDTITLTLSEEIARNENIFVFGQYVADC